ncbi:MAG: hypothetical protein JNK04_07690 [Myxococcales bacterium]|nr:hypothetical protein [Myxococcales bacterium]
MSGFNPYSAPQSDERLPPPEVDIPDEVEKKIRNAWIAGLISGSLTLLVTLLALAGTSLLGFTGWELIDVALIFGLTFGIYKKSRACAVALLVYFVGSKILMMVEGGAPSGLVMAAVLAYYFAQGVSGTFEYQRRMRAPRLPD